MRIAPLTRLWGALALIGVCAVGIGQSMPPLRAQAAPGGYAGATGTPMVSATPTPTPTATPTPTPTATPVTSLPPITRCAGATPRWRREPLSRTLRDWVAGRLRIPTSWRFTAPYLSASTGLVTLPEPLGYFASHPNDPTQPGQDSARYHAVLLGQEIVDRHLIVFLGFEDVDCNQFFVPITSGSLDDQTPRYLGHYPSRALTDYYPHTFDRLTVRKLKKRLARLRQTTIQIDVYLTTSVFTPTVRYYKHYRRLVSPQVPVSLRLESYLFETTQQRAYLDMPRFRLINYAPAHFDPTRIPWSGTVEAHPPGGSS